MFFERGICLLLFSSVDSPSPPSDRIYEYVRQFLLN